MAIGDAALFVVYDETKQVQEITIELVGQNVSETNFIVQEETN